MNILAILFLLAIVAYIGKSIFDLVRHQTLTQREKANLAFLITLIPLFGSIVFYFYASRIRAHVRR